MDQDQKLKFIFICYSHEDEYWKDRVRKYLKKLEKVSSIVTWDDRKIDPGDDWFDKIKEAMDRASVAIGLVSDHFLTSEFINKEEIPYLLERRSKGGLIFLPILVRGCEWQDVRWLAPIQMLPRDGKNLTDHYSENVDNIFEELVNLISEKISNPAFSQQYSKSAWPELPEEYVDLSDLPETASELFGRNNDLNLLDRAWDDQGINIVCLYGWSGIGKTALMKKWLNDMKHDHFRGADRVYAFSFKKEYGTAENFLYWAYKWFRDADKNIFKGFANKSNDSKDPNEEIELN